MWRPGEKAAALFDRILKMTGSASRGEEDLLTSDSDSSFSHNIKGGGATSPRYDPPHPPPYPSEEVFADRVTSMNIKNREATASRSATSPIIKRGREGSSTQRDQVPIGTGPGTATSSSSSSSGHTKREKEGSSTQRDQVPTATDSRTGSPSRASTSSHPPTSTTATTSAANKTSSSLPVPSPSASSSVHQIKLAAGDRCFIIRADATRHPAEVIETRVYAEAGGATEYYIHYDGLNRRLDEWVGAERIDLNYKAPANLLKRPGGPSELDEDSQASASSDAEGRKLTRNQKRKQEEVTSLARHKLLECRESPDGTLSMVSVALTPSIASVAAAAAVSAHPALLEIDPRIAELEREHESLTKVKYIQSIQLGKWEIDTWYFSPYPDEFGKLAKLWICEFCLWYMKSEAMYRYHMGSCPWVRVNDYDADAGRHPPGLEIYHTARLSVYEIYGEEHKVYCQSLCLLAKLFLDHKTLYYDVSPFVFYVLAERDARGVHPVGYFSKEIDSPERNNLACIMVLPPHQKSGYGKFLIALSYELSRLERVIGSPEKPLSDLGSLSYLSYWTYTLVNQLRLITPSKGGPDSMSSLHRISIAKLSEQTAIARVDIIETLDALGLIKYWRDGHVVQVTHKMLNDIVEHSPRYSAPRLTVDRRLLKWSTAKTHPHGGSGASKGSHQHHHHHHHGQRSHHADRGGGDGPGPGPGTPSGSGRSGSVVRGMSSLALTSSSGSGSGSSHKQHHHHSGGGPGGGGGKPPVSDQVYQQAASKWKQSNKKNK